MNITIKMEVTDGEHTLNSEIGLDLIESTKDMGIDLVSETASALINEFKIEKYLKIARANGTPTHYDENFDIKKLSDEQREAYQEFLVLIGHEET